MRLENYFQIILCLVAVGFFAKGERNRRGNQRKITVEWGGHYMSLEGYNHKDTIKLGTFVINKEGGPKKRYFRSWFKWFRRCSTCHQRMTSPPCSLNPYTREGFHTVAGNKGRPVANSGLPSKRSMS